MGAENATTTREFTLSPAKTSYFTNPTGLPGVFFHTSDLKTLWFLRGSVLSTPFFAHPWLPEARNHTKMLFEITCQKVLQDSCGTEANKDHGSVAGFWGRMPHWRSGHRASKRSCLAVAERVGVCLDVLESPKAQRLYRRYRLPISLPRGPPPCRVHPLSWGPKFHCTSSSNPSFDS